MFLVEGGNVRIGEYGADRIDITKIGVSEIRSSLLHVLSDLNALFHKKYGVFIWDEKTLKAGKIFSGSAFHLMTTKNIKLLKTHKPSFGDIDLQVSNELKEKVSGFLDALKYHSTFASYIGCKQSIGQTITLFTFNFKEKGSINIQIDFEYVPFKQNEPTEWAKFSHSSSLKDIQAGIKGVFHKYLIRSLTAKEIEDAILFAIKRKKETFEPKQIKKFAFFASYGIRQKYKDTGEVKDGKKVYIEDKNTNADNYISSIPQLLTLLFGIKEHTKKDVDNFFSFVGCVELIKKYIKDHTQLYNIVMSFANLLWFDKRAQPLYRGDPVRDNMEKTIAFEYLKNELKVDIPSKFIEDGKKQYYENYK